jgi:hypothetical protein
LIVRQASKSRFHLLHGGFDFLHHCWRSALTAELKPIKENPFGLCSHLRWNIA